VVEGWTLSNKNAAEEAHLKWRESPKVTPQEDPSRDPTRTKEGKQGMGRLIVVNSMNKMTSQQSNMLKSSRWSAI
jgi:hypothetical protein